jgi:arabinan endo-1,5-alpha-L-arabinosidase
LHGGARMRSVPFLLVVAVACATETSEADFSDAAWSEAEEPDMAAELEEAAAAPDLELADLVDDAPDLAEPDEAAAEAGPADDALAAARFQNPLGPSCADPGIIRIADAEGPTFWVACTGNGYPLFSSRDLVHWRSAGHIFTLATKPKWAGGNYWAPEVHHVGDGLVAYFTALSPSRGKMCIGAARAKTMAGPWRDLGHPLVCDAHVSLIDATVHAAGGALYLYYKTDGNGLRPQEPTILYGHQLRADGLGFVGKRRALVRNTLAWEGDVVEAPWVHHRGNYYYLFYSGFRYCNDTYGVGIARSRSPLGPFTKRSAPILHSSRAWSGPGHNAVVRSAGKPYLVYHAWRGDHACGDPGARQLMLDPIAWSGGWPVIRGAIPGSGAQPAPAVP